MAGPVGFARQEHSMKQSYGALRIVRVLPPLNATARSQVKYPVGWLPGGELVHVLTRCETTIGRALTNDIVLMDSTVSREHVRLVLDSYGWHIVNLKAQNIVYVNGCSVPTAGDLLVQPQDTIILGSTVLQLIAPQNQRHAPSQVSLRPHGFPIGWGGAHYTPSFSAKTPLLGWQQHPSSSAKPNGQREQLVMSPLSIQPDPELEPQPWEDVEAESLLGAGVTMQFALPQRIGKHMRWFIAGIGIAILAISAVITVALNSLLGLPALEQNDPASLVTAFAIPLLPALGINLLVHFMDRFEREPWFLRLAAFLWGAIIAIPLALFIERRVDSLLQSLLGPGTSDALRSALQGLNAGATEEIVKGLGLLLLFLLLRDEFDNVTDGIVYGTLIGAGFALVENFRYFALDFKDFPVFLIVYRILLGWLDHSTFTVCFGAALGYVRHTHVRWHQIVIPLLGFICAIGLHSFFNFVVFQANATVLAASGNSSVTFFSLIAIIGNYIPPFLAQICLLYVLINALAHEAEIIREFLAVEVRNGVVSVDEYALLQNSFRRTREERRVFWESGFTQWLRVKTLHQTEIRLAFRKWHVSMGEKSKPGVRQPEDVYRERIQRLHREIMAPRR